MIKRLSIALLIALIGVAGAFAAGSQEGTDTQNGASSGDQETAEQQELTFWTMSLSPAFDEYINGVIEDFESQNSNVTVEWVDVPWGDMETKILTAAASDSMPDVVNLNLPFSQKLAQNDLLVNMEEAAADARSQYF
ncbi:MAG: extracellular solute-binding protein, partial [Spirochaetes bacterium]|nr:extracellular solute-binding protein [Spirochaetota bacterium]